jgi:hypothetical protein
MLGRLRGFVATMMWLIFAAVLYLFLIRAAVSVAIGVLR